MTERLTYRVNEVAAMLGYSRLTIERKIKSGTLKSFKDGRSRLILADSVRALLPGEETKQPAPLPKETAPKLPLKRVASRGRRRANMLLPSRPAAGRTRG
jgi:excisionase family DNA binding protein